MLNQPLVPESAVPELMRSLRVLNEQSLNHSAVLIQLAADLVQLEHRLARLEELKKVLDKNS